MEEFERVALSNQQKAREIVEDLDIARAWRQIGAEARLVGSLRMGLLCKHLDIDFHVYSSPVKVEESFKVVACLASNPKVRKVEYRNLLDTEEACVEWHLWYEESPERVWQIDMIHIETGSAMMAILNPKSNDRFGLNMSLTGLSLPWHRCNGKSSCA